MKKAILDYWQSFCQKVGIPENTPYEAFAFGDTKEMADELGTLVVQKLKTGTSSGHALYEAAQERLPSKGDFSVVLDGAGVPLCVIVNKEVTVVPFSQITEEHAAKEGEGDLSLAYWQKVHLDFWGKYYRQELGREFSNEDLVVFEEFERVDL